MIFYFFDPFLSVTQKLRLKSKIWVLDVHFKIPKSETVQYFIKKTTDFKGVIHNPLFTPKGKVTSIKMQIFSWLESLKFWCHPNSKAQLQQIWLHSWENWENVSICKILKKK